MQRFYSRHVAELLGKFATVGATGRKSSSPGESLFTRFREAWPEISQTIDYSRINDLITTFDWAQWEGTDVARAAKEAKQFVKNCARDQTFNRNDYMHGITFILLFLGVKVKEGATFALPDLAEVSNARFLQRFAFSLLLLIYTKNLN